MTTPPWCREKVMVYYNRRSGSTAQESGGATSELYLPSLTPLTIAGCGRLRLRVPHWATSVDYCK